MDKYAELKTFLGDRITSDRFERTLYSRDLAPMPGIMNILYKGTPDLVVMPVNASEISDIIKFANKHRISVTPRGNATSALAGAVPTRGGIVLDMSSMNKKIELNENEKTVNVDAGVVWGDLERYLNSRGFSLMSYPSSAPSATVGGWLSSPGLGIGTLQHGSVHSQVLSALIIMPGGEIRRFSRNDKKTRGDEPSLDWFLGSEGTSGIIAEAELQVREKPADTYTCLIVYDHLKEFCDALQRISGLKPFHIAYSDSNYHKLVEEAGYETPTRAEYTILVRFEGSPVDVMKSAGGLDKIMGDTGGLKLSRKAAEDEWGNRFNMMRIKRAGPTLLAGDVMVPPGMLYDALTGIYAELKAKRLRFGIEGFIPCEGIGMIMPVYMSDERKPLRYLFDLRHIRKINDIAVSVGGKPYGAGLWNSPYLNSIMSKRLKGIKRRIKKRLDPKGVLNPDKHVGVKSPLLLLLLNPAFYRMSMSMLELTSKPMDWALNQIGEYL